MNGRTIIGPNISQRKNWIDWTKSICMFLVILGHTHIDDSGIMVKKIIYTFHMPLFFFISGILCKNQLSIRTFIRDIKFIIIPYFFFGILGIIIPHPKPLSDIPPYLYNLFFGFDSSIGAIWFLPAIFLCKQLGTAIISIQYRHKWLFLFLIVYTFFTPYYIKNINLPFFASSAFFGLPFFLIGYTSMKYYQYHFIHRLLSHNSSLAITFILSLIVTIILANKHEIVALAGHSYGNDIVLFYLNAVAGIISILSLSILLNNIRLRFVVVTAYGSVSIIWIHGIFLSFFHYYLFRLLNIEITTYPIEMATLLSLLTSYCCYVSIVFFDKHCPILFGLKGKLTNL